MLMDKINVAEWISRKFSLFGKMQRGRSPSFELYQLDMYEAIQFFAVAFASVMLAENKGKWE